ncbi:MAG: hypothetical protein IPK64_21765 [bacterium]|nr:hypothetical protein [bacterium]
MNLTLNGPQATLRQLEDALSATGLVTHRNYPAKASKQAMLHLTVETGAQLQQAVAALAALARRPGAPL